MAMLGIALENGFDDDHVVVTVDGTAVLNEEHVNTRYQLGLARLIEIPVAGPVCTVRVQLPARGLDGDVEVDVGAAPFVRVSVVNGHLDVSPSDQPLFYA